MTKKSEYNNIILKFPQDYYYNLRDVAKDEIEVAMKKWKVELSDDEKDLVSYHSFAQLVKKVEDVCYNQFSLYDNKVKIRILDERTKSSDNRTERHGKILFELSSDNISDNSFLGENILFNVTDGYSFTDIPTTKTVKVEDFHNNFIKNLEKWLRTAIFYGVGSFSS